MMSQSEKKIPDSAKKVRVLVTDEVLCDVLRAAIEGLSQVGVNVDISLVNELNSISPEESNHLTVAFSEFFGPDYVHDMIVAASPRRAELPTLGYQRHLIPGDLLAALYHLCPLSLGGLRDQSELIEPVTRQVESVLWSCDAIRRSDTGVGPVTGMTIEEACQVARSLGESRYLRQVCFEVPQSEYTPQWVDCCAVLLWYLTEGYNLRLQSTEQDFSDMQEIIVTFSDMDVALVRSEKSGKLWVKNDDDYIPIHDTEYIQITEGKLPLRVERLLYA